MPMNIQIREGRKRLGLTQEQMADYLGVTAPAVNKWESGATCPDVSLLPALARLLETDLNTLLCFEEQLTDTELLRILEEVQNVLIQEGLDRGFALARKKIQEFPSCTELLHKLVLLLDGNLAMSGRAAEEKRKYEEQVLSFYERLAKNPKAKAAERDGALFMLCSKYMGMEDYEKAEELLKLLPEPSDLDKRQMKANLLLKKGETDEAAQILERKLMLSLNQIQNLLFSLMEIEEEEHCPERAEHLADLSEKLAETFEMGKYYPSAARMQAAIFRKDAEDSLRWIEQVLEHSEELRNIWENDLYHHLAEKVRGGQSKPETEKKAASLIPGLLAGLKDDPKCEFLRGNPQFQELLKRYR